MTNLEKAESLLNMLVESNPDHAKRVLESLLAKIELRKRLATKRAQAEPVAFDPAEAMRLADNYASAQSEMDSEHSVNRQYYVQSRDEERAKLASYLGIKEAK